VLARVAAILRTNVETLVERWVGALRALPAGELPSDESRFDGEVRGTVSLMLHDVAQRLEQPPAPENAEWREQLAEHLGRLRHQQGYRLHDVVREYVVLRQQVWTLYCQRLRGQDKPFINFVTQLNEGIDSLLLATATAFHHAHVRELERWAATDSLTGLLNRRYFFERLREELLRSKRTDEPFSVLMLDLNRFKRYNDTHGHQAGDAMLVAVAEAVRHSIRGHDVLARYGGDEFIILLPHSGLEPEQLAQRIVDNVAAVGRDAGDAAEGEDGAPISISIGIARYPQHGDNGDALVGAADAALYRAKRSSTAIASGPEDG
jgi:diguanylate cyclase (GGDEF)-like protein